MFTTYILYSNSFDKYYIGHTANINDRINRHNSGRSKYTKFGIPWKIVYSEEFRTKSEAYQRELYLKHKKSKVFIENLIRK